MNGKNFFRIGAFGCVLTGALALAGCGDDSGLGPDGGGADAAVDGGGAPSLPPVNPEAATRGFKLYYKERLNRALTAYNRYQMIGDASFALGTGNPMVKKVGDAIEVVPLFGDNNKFGTAAFNTYYAYKALGTRELELTLLRMLEGLVFFEEVTGHPGLTSRDARPGWTRTMDGVAGKVTRTRGGKSFTPPAMTALDIDLDVLGAFYDGVRITYREDPTDFSFSYEPAADPVEYSVTRSHAIIPGYIPLSDCCATAVQVPAGNTWEGAFWSNHNSRDNWPDIGLGYAAARLALEDPNASDAVHDAARRAVASGKNIGDLIFESGGNLMTVSEHDSYDKLLVSGAIRPHGLSENEDLGSLANCPDAYLSKALSSDGLALPVPEIPVPGAATVESMLMEGMINCEPDPDRTCTSLFDGFCGIAWGESDKLTALGMPFLDVVRTLEKASPGMAETLLGRFQGDFEHIVESMLAIIHWSVATGDEELAAETRKALKDMTDLMREFADVIWPDPTNESRRSQEAEAARLDAIAGVDVIEEHRGDFADEENRISKMEELLNLSDTEPATLLTDAEILEKVEAKLADLQADTHPSGRAQVVYDRYRDAYDMEPPVRRKGNGYEARRTGGDWMPAEVPQHTHAGGRELLALAPICDTAPEIIDCRWAKLGCARADLNGDKLVDAKDESRFDAEFEAGRVCGRDEAIGRSVPCDGLDLDGSGKLDDLDQAFMAAADGCWY